jgi:methyltransferase (TIGR00027 family)
MKEGRPSWTAELMAFFRAHESVRPAFTRLFTDPYAPAFLSTPLRTALTLARLPGGIRAVQGIIERRWGGPLGAAVCRTRFIDDALESEVTAGIEQVVILGAGFDCRAYRLPLLAGTRVFEVDHPLTQSMKRARLAPRLGVIPPHVVYVPVDFARNNLAASMDTAGFRPTARTFFLWEGVTNYLTDEAVDATLRWVARAGSAGSTLLFTYIHRGMLDGSLRFDGAEASRRTVERSGEPYTFGLDPGEVAAYLRQRGLELVEDVAAPEYRTRYLEPLGRAMKIWEFYRAAVTRVI